VRVTGDIAVLVSALALSTAASAAPLNVCGRYGVTCMRVSVPLDPSGTVPGRLSLAVEVRRAKAPRGVMFLMAGGPGQASTSFFDLRPWGSWSQLFPGYTLVTFDPRGTGDSDPIRCNVSDARNDASIGTQCAQQLGAKAAFFSTGDNVRDADAVRQALGFHRIGIYGASYGTVVALDYARTFPGHVQRLVLDSVASPTNSLPVLGEVVRQIPATLNRFCANACTGITRNYGRDVVRLANMLSTKPLGGLVLEADGRKHLRRLNAAWFLGLVFQTDLDPGLAAELPAAVHAALHGDAQPLLRLADLVESSGIGQSLGAVYTATNCNDGAFPWQPDTPLADRQALFDGAVAALPGNSFGGFGSWAEHFGNASLCLGWPTASAETASAAVAYPNVPVLAVNGALDLRTPRSGAQAAMVHFPQGHLLTVTNAGHAALADTGYLPCLVSAVHNWLKQAIVPSVCDSPRLLAPVGPFPVVATGRSVQSARTARDLTLVRETVREAAATWLLAYSEGILRPVPGLLEGRLTRTEFGFALDHYGISPNIALSGEVHPEYSGVDKAPQLHGILQVLRGAHVIGTLALNGDALDGRLTGTTITSVRARAERVSTRRPAWSAWTAPRGSTATVTSAIAAHIAAEYHLDARGTKLVAVTAGPPTLPTVEKHSISAIDVQASVRAVGQSTVHTTFGTWSYRLCGQGPNCAIAGGRASTTRGRLVRREALELALETFDHVPQLSSVVIYMVPPPGEPPSEVLYFERTELTKQLAKPLNATLTLPSPPLPDAADNREAANIDSLTFPHLYNYSATNLTGGGTELRLTPSE
jgi:pimeloyl-ACP methyl ester carboxylesterase